MRGSEQAAAMSAASGLGRGEIRRPPDTFCDLPPITQATGDPAAGGQGALLAALAELMSGQGSEALAVCVHTPSYSPLFCRPSRLLRTVDPGPSHRQVH